MIYTLLSIWFTLGILSVYVLRLHDNKHPRAWSFTYYDDLKRSWDNDIFDYIEWYEHKGTAYGFCAFYIIAGPIVPAGYFLFRLVVGTALAVTKAFYDFIDAILPE